MSLMLLKDANLNLRLTKSKIMPMVFILSKQLTELAKSRLNISLKSDQEVLSWADSPRRCRKDEEIMRFYKQLIVLSFTKGDVSLGHYFLLCASMLDFTSDVLITQREARLRNYTCVNIIWFNFLLFTPFFI